jgi:hypothetical protein
MASDPMSRTAKPKSWVHHKMSDDKALRILPGLRAGLTLKQLREVPRRFQAYCDAHPDYAREARPLEAANAAAARNRKGARIRDKTHCVNGHLLAEHGRVAVHKGWVTRQCRACERMVLAWRGNEAWSAGEGYGPHCRRIGDPQFH